MPSKYEKKRKRDVDTTEGENYDGHGSSSSKRSHRRRDHDRDSSSEPGEGNSGGKNTESLSIEETNKLRAKLGLAPLELDNEPPPKPLPGQEGTEDGDLPKLTEDEELFKEDGVSIVHKKAKNWGEEKQAEKLKAKLDAHKQKRQIESKVLKVRKGLAESDSEDEVASEWVKKTRELEEQRKKAEQKAKLLDEMDEAFGIGGLIEQERKRIDKPLRRTQHKANALTAGLIVGHSKEDFVDGKETVLVLQDKGVLEADEDEVLINPNLLENERHKRNVDLKKRKDPYRPYDETDVDEFGQPTKQKILSKYDEGLDGDEKERAIFRLDSSGGYDLDKEAHEEEVKRKLLMANKKFESLQMTKPALAREFYTEEEMISFRRPSKKKDSTKIRKRKTLKASDLEQEIGTETAQEKESRAAKLAARRREAESNGRGIASGGFKEPISVPKEEQKEAKAKLEEGELDEPEVESRPTKETRVKDKWKAGTGAAVDVDKLRKFAEVKSNKNTQLEEDEDEEESEDDLVGGVDLSGVILDDDAEDELGAALERARKLKQEAAKQSSNGVTGAEQVRAMLLQRGELKKEIKEEDMEEDEEQLEESGGRKHIVFDATSEQYKTIGDIHAFGLAGNREDGIDYATMAEEAAEKMIKEEPKKKYSDIDSDEEMVSKKDKHKKKKRSKKETERSWKEESMEVDEPGPSKTKSSKRKSTSSKRRRDSDEDDVPPGYENVLGKEEDVTKGVGAMLKLAGVKGYLEAGNAKHAGAGALTQMLESKRFSKVEQGRYDIEDKTMRKLERMGTTGTGPIRPFMEKPDYKPNIEINYSDNKGRVMGAKEAFRALSWKFHGKGPGKKQIEKHQAKLEKKEKLKMMNSSDTPLHTLDKQRTKQEQLGTPYLILSGTGRDTGTTLQKE